MSELPQNRRAPMRMDAEDGPWTVSVAESPHDTRSYSLYIKTPTHNLTLTRTAFEIVELDAKLRETCPAVRLPPLPLDADAVLALPKRKSTFLNTLSRLASPHGNKVRRSNNVNSASTAPSSATSPIPTPAKEEPSDPFQSFTSSAITSTVAPTVNSTALAAYLTTLSNTQGLRQARHWRRFIRVRADDLESVRVERAIKRVRSDLAAHTGMRPKSDFDKENDGEDEDVVSELKQEQELPPLPPPTDSLPPTPGDEESIDIGEEPESEEDEVPIVPPPAPYPEEPPAPAPPANVRKDSTSNRLHRSRSADLSSAAARQPRSYPSSSSMLTDGASESQTETGDESSVSNGGKKPKKKLSMDPKRKSRKVGVDDFEMMRVLGKGCAGKVLLVRHKQNTELFAMKAITKRHVLAHQELQHTLTEQAVLKRMAAEGKDPFVVRLWWSFHDKEHLFLVLDFHPGGDLATQLARWGRLGRDRARFYAAEIVEGVEGLHHAGVIYRDLKPENILIGADGHIVLTDFGLSKEFQKPAGDAAPGTPTGPPWLKMGSGGEMLSGWQSQPSGDMTTTFCGTAEYLAPEVIQGLTYSYEVDWWSFGTMLYEMLTGITPFWAANHPDMYVRVLQDELNFPDDRVMDQDTKSLLRGLLQRNPNLRLCEPRIKKHPYFSMIDWSHVFYKRYIPPYIPPIDPSNATDTQNFDDTFLDMEPVLDVYEGDEQTDDQEGGEHTDTDRETSTTPSQSRSSSVVRESKDDEGVPDAFDGYSFKGRQSVYIADEDEEDEDESSDDETDEEEEEALAQKGMELDAATPVTPTADAATAEGPSATEAVHAKLPLDDIDVTKLPPLPDSPPPSIKRSKKKVTLPEEKPPVPPADTKPPPPPKARKSGDELHAGHAANEKPLPPAAPIYSRYTRPGRREKSGVPALDKYLSDAGEDAPMERDEEDDDWDFVEAVEGEERNGTRGTTLFARGVVDRYKLAVFNRKASTPSQPMTPSELGDSPSPVEKRGRNQLSFRKNTRQFLKPKTPPTSFTSRGGMMKRRSSTGKFSTVSSVGASSVAGGSSVTGESDGGHTLTSKPSEMSMGGVISLSESDAPEGFDSVTNSPPGDKKTKKLKKYKENAEKVFSLFAPSPKPSSAAFNGGKEKETKEKE
ncbi:hypothetical protein CYLTODRAFT_397962 [Cylindrobasidium torrendii FP15055 ss-10]|uniref:Kinase-like protein n=1 Tax=Cylindrobasidium torrendii FP15055 ss-10 TaxID=1314674 RepID=A0A0D7B8V1_9AGAR|nr:hypothetical protein CYLTODRAFT_397962 [Cylindrobasidium torrendii FP15055 ss-10]